MKDAILLVVCLVVFPVSSVLAIVSAYRSHANMLNRVAALEARVSELADALDATRNGASSGALACAPDASGAPACTPDSGAQPGEPRQ